MRSLTSAAPWNGKKQPEERACESCCKPFMPPASYPDAPLCTRCYIEEKRMVKAERGPPGPSRPTNANAWRLSQEWLSAEEFAIVEEAMSKQVKP